MDRKAFTQFTSRIDRFKFYTLYHVIGASFCVKTNKLHLASPFTSQKSEKGIQDFNTLKDLSSIIHGYTINFQSPMFHNSSLFV